MSSVSFSRLLRPITFAVFLPLSLFLLLLNKKIIQLGLDPLVLIFGNGILYVITAIALYFHQKGFVASNPNVFFRSVYASMLLRMFVCIVAVVLYALLSGSGINKYSLLICFVFYFLYAFTEVRQIFSLMKKQS